MTDYLVERLRGVSPALGAGTKLCNEAADEIERLRAALSKAIVPQDRPRDDGTVVAVGGEPGASAGSSE